MVDYNVRRQQGMNFSTEGRIIMDYYYYGHYYSNGTHSLQSIGKWPIAVNFSKSILMKKETYPILYG